MKRWNLSRLFAAAALIAASLRAQAPQQTAPAQLAPPAKSMPTAAPPPVNAAITTPEKFFGFRMGADKHMARWDKIVDYMHLLAKQSTRIKVETMGQTSMGNPFLAVYISSPANLARLDAIRKDNLKLADPRGVADSTLRRIVKNGKAVVVQSMSMHATEIGGTQMAPELIYDLVARTDAETQRILDNVISIMVPGFNPDGEIMVTDWYNKYLGTEYEGTSPPWLYQKYTGHDNNRDAFMMNVVESQYMGKLLFREWKPQVYVDHHGMGANGARIFLPPYAEPVRPSADPLVWREIAWYGAEMAAKEEQQNLSGAINNAIYSGWGHMGFHWITPFHNIAGMLTESAAASLATPLEMPLDRLRGGDRNLPKYEEEVAMPNPWPGGTWHLRDIVDRQKVSAWATLDLTARNKETVLEDAILKARRQTERGAAGNVKAYVIPIDQHDPLTTIKMVNKLLGQGLDVQRATKPFSAGGKQYAAGSFVVSMAQPKMGVARWLLGRTFYPDNTWTREQNGTPIAPYDMSTDTMDEFMGVTADSVTTAVTADLVLVKGLINPAGKVSKGSNGYLLSGHLNDAAHAVNLLFAKGISVRRVDKAAGGAEAGDFAVDGGAPTADITAIAAKTGVDFNALNSDVTSSSHAMKAQRIAMYERYSGGNIDQGWSQFVFDTWEFPVASLKDPELKAGNLIAKYDVIVIPADNIGTLTGERGAGGGGRGGPPGAGAPGAAGAAGAGRGAGGGGGGRGFGAPPEYRTGFGEDGVNALKTFVQAGGTLVTFAEASSLAIEKFNLPLKDAVAGKTTKEFWSPGSTFKIVVDNTNPLGYGMPVNAFAVWMRGSQAWDITDPSAKVETIARYLDKDVLQSGWLDGEKYIAGKAAMVSAPYGQGRLVLIGFRTQHRAQTHGTFKFLFNALMK
jgi:hypothetical protein